MMKSVAAALALSAATSIAVSSSAPGQVVQSGYSLPLPLVVEAAVTAVDACEAEGWLLITRAVAKIRR